MLLLNFVCSVMVLCCQCIHHFASAVHFLHVDVQKYSSSL